jgi:hypothetical protein
VVVHRGRVTEAQRLEVRACLGLCEIR